MLQISNMVTEILTSEDTVRVVDGLSLTLNRGEICALVGESGCGKSMTAFSIETSAKLRTSLERCCYR